MSKKCGKCAVIKDLSEYNKHGVAKDGLQSRCRSCNKTDRKLWRETNKEHHNRLIRVSKLRVQGVTLTVEELVEMHKTQNNLCAICCRPETLSNGQGQGPASLAVDHCHTTNKVRELLCRLCNIGIAAFKEDTETMLKAIEYLKKHKGLPHTTP